MVNDSTDNYGLSSMTKEKIVSLCKKHKLYVTPRLNDVLYLHYQGFTEIKELDEYVGLKCLYLECNAISEISGLDKQSELRCLLLHNNVIKKIENLGHCTHLDSINLSHNFITTIENLGSDILPKLNTLTITNNCLRTEESIANLVHCKTLSVLDLSHNRIDDIVIVKILGQMPELRVLVLTGNPVVNQIPSYRKTLIINCKQLTYLDTRPVFDVDRACAEAWKRGGYEEERKERERWNQEERRKLVSSFNSTIAIRETERLEMENDLITPTEPLNSNDEQAKVPKITEVATNYNSDDPSSSQESCSNEFQDLSGDYLLSNSLTKSDDFETCQSGDDSNTSEYTFEDVENDEYVKNNKISSDCSFSATLEQVFINDCVVSDGANSQVGEDPLTHDNNLKSENLAVTCENSNLLFIEEIKEIQESKDAANKIIEEIMSLSSDNCNNQINVLKPLREIGNFDADFEKDIENSKENEINQRRNSTKITFYCENVDKLMCDLVGEEYDEPIQEINQIIDDSV